MVGDGELHSLCVPTMLISYLFLRIGLFNTFYQEDYFLLQIFKA